VLSQSDVPKYLTEQQLLPPSSIVDDDLEVVEMSRRNWSFRVATGTGPQYFLKQGPGSAVEALPTMAHEAGIYQLLSSAPDTAGLRAFLPRYIDYHAEHDLLILELLRGCEDLSTHHARTRRFPLACSRALGLTLSTLHREGTRAAKLSQNSNLHGRRPWALDLDRPSLQTLLGMSSANVRLISIIQSSNELRRNLKILRGEWRNDALIHHDIKWDNCLVFAKNDSKRITELRLVDWEFADWGDPCWDAGAVLGNFLSSWLMSVPISGQEPPDRYLSLAARPLSAMHPAITAYWAAYVEGMKLGAGPSSNYLMRAVKYAAVRLLQTAYEQMQVSAVVTGNAVCLVQLSENILANPHLAATHLLGLPLDMEPR
jgi:hypothetical protein